VLKEFKKFILRGNVVDLAVGVVIGAAFTTVVQSFVKDIITPTLAAFGGTQHFADAHFTIHRSIFMYGDFLNALISFLIVAAVVFFFVVQPINRLTAFASRSKQAEDSADRKCPQCLSEIPKAAKRCKFCTAEVRPA
jgi:large conductance mechanosensitive channel